jgi:HEAT repeat protein
MSTKLIFILILSVSSLILFFLFSSIFRRILNSRKYKALDRHRKFYKEKILRAMQRGNLMRQSVFFLLRFSPKSIKWQAIEDILLLLIAEEKYKENAKEFFNKLDYVGFYEKKLESKNLIKKAAAIDKLGKMLSESSIEKLLAVLESEKKSAEIISITIRALSRIGLLEGLIGILEQLPNIWGKDLVSRKTIESSLINFGLPAVPELIKYGRRYDDPQMRASLLEVLSGLPLTQLSCAFALENLDHSEAEVRAKALMLLGLANDFSINIDPDLLLPSLNDEVWYVRLQAVKAFAKMKQEKAIGILGNLLLDTNWQVRNAASRALAAMEDASLDVFLKILKSEDRYARESVCEEIERTNLAKRLIENLDSLDRDVCEKSKKILGHMHSLNFSTPLLDYLKKETRSLKEKISALLNEAQPA